jgi:flagellum-specific ATP synthase
VNILGSLSRIPHPLRSAEQSALVGRLRALVARFEETRELRLMGGYSAGGDPVLDQAVKTVPRIYESMTQTLAAPLSQDPFIELAAALRNAPAGEPAADPSATRGSAG